MRQILQSYLRRLTNLSGSNRSLLLLRLYGGHFIDLHAFDFLNNKPSFHIIQQLIARKTKISLCKNLDSRDGAANEVSLALKQLARTDKFIHEERGSKDLYIGWPFVRGKFADHSLVRCPLIFFPVALHQSKGEWKLTIREDVGASLNKSFLLAFSYFNKARLDESLLEHSFEDYDSDSRIFRTALYQLLKESPLEINFNQENFLDRLAPFEAFKKADYEKKYKSGELKLFPEAVLGIFPQAGSYLVPDYQYLIEHNSVQDIEEFFLSRSIEEDRSSVNKFGYHYFLNKIKEEQTITPFDIDAYQENAIKAVKAGNSIVVQGPPGSGKSQLICNLISDHIARGRRVLLVCQKRVALDVVHERMKEKGLSDFTALVHDFKNDRKRIYEQIATQIDRIADYRMKNNSLDAIQLERQFLQASRKIDQVDEELEELKFALYDDGECKLSIKELYLTSDMFKPNISLRQEYKYFTFDEVEKFIPLLRIYSAYAIRFNKEDYPWKNRVRFKDYGLSELKEIQKLLKEVPAYQEKIADEIESVVGERLSLEQCEAILAREEKIKELLRNLLSPEVYEYFVHMVGFKDKETDYLWIGTMERVVMECFKGPGPETSLKTRELGRFQEALQRRIEARKGIIRFIRWRLFSKEKAFIRKTLSANGLQPNRKDFRILVEKVDNRLNLEHNLTKIRNYRALKDIPKEYSKEVFEKWFSDQKRAVLSKLIFSSLRNFKEYFNVQKLNYDQLKDKLEALVTSLWDIPRQKERWLMYLTPKQIHFILEEPDFDKKLLKTINSDFDALCDFDNLSDNLKPHERDTIGKLLEAADELNEDEIINLFQNSIRLAWIEHIETKYPVLRAVSTLKFERILQEFQENVKDKHQISGEIALLRARENTYQDLEFNRLNNQVTYRDLRHQVTKKKKIWPLRKLIANFQSELFDLIPCWMASPESVSAIFPMEQVFDLVIFDEASQCFAERGAPAMYRGKQVVVAGDDKQLQPFDLYKARWEEDEEDDPALEVDSLLDLAKQHLMQIQLQGHYRSQSLDLIDFSNAHFYNGKLTLLPERGLLNKADPAIEYLKTEGVWEKNVNEKEADETVNLVVKLLNEKKDKEIGVITFNHAQQNLIADLLDERASRDSLVIPDSLFIKNIENVQGDEKDIIIFSTAYAPDKKGKMIMQFGSLNQEGGENRLNVAITRAREKVYVVSSILPHQLKVEDSKNEGPKLLKAYLNYALEVSQGKFKPSLRPEQSFGPDWYLKSRIAEIFSEALKEIELTGDLPFADMAIKSNGDYLGLVMTDDLLYQQSISVKESHVYKPFTLSRKNWQFRQFFSREYWHDPEAIKERIVRFIKTSL